MLIVLNSIRNYVKYYLLILVPVGSKQLLFDILVLRNFNSDVFPLNLSFKNRDNCFDKLFEAFSRILPRNVLPCSNLHLGDLNLIEIMKCPGTLVDLLAQFELLPKVSIGIIYSVHQCL